MKTQIISRDSTGSLGAVGSERAANRVLMEAALSKTICHTNIVTTYTYEVTPVVSKYVFHCDTWL